MSSREVVMLGTGSQRPTRHRNHNGYALRWDGNLVLFDPGEGFQRQCTIAGIAIAAADAVCLTHFHGDHCLGLPGVMLTRAASRVPDPLDVWFPGDGVEFYDKLLTSTAAMVEPPLVAHPIEPGGIEEGGVAGAVGDLTLTALPLRHRVTAFGYRLDEPDGRSFDVDELDARGISGADVGRLRRDGELQTPGGLVALEDVSVERPGQSMALVMDTAICDNIGALARDVDLLVIESTFLDHDANLAETYLHLTAGQAGRLAADAGARRVVLTHFSARYDDVSAFVAEASAHHPDVHGASDFDVVPVPLRD